MTLDNLICPKSHHQVVEPHLSKKRVVEPHLNPYLDKKLIVYLTNYELYHHQIITCYKISNLFSFITFKLYEFSINIIHITQILMLLIIFSV